jgi:site-specific DNA-methyltransferase (adenine-specific)
MNRIICGDALTEMKAMPDKCFDLVLTDPPYGIDSAGSKRATGLKPVNFAGKNKRVAAKDYGNKDWDKKHLDGEYFSEMRRVSKHQIIFGGNYYVEYLSNSSCWIVWDKLNGKSNYADCELAWTSFDMATRLFRWKWHGMLQQDMRNKEERVHPTQKPVKLGVWILKNYAKPGDTILDPFCGSGSFVIAAAQLGFDWLGIDSDSEYVALAEARLKRETAQMRLL